MSMRLVLSLALLFAPGCFAPASADFVGLDFSGDLVCDRTDMGWTAGEWDVGSIGSLYLFFDDLPPIIGWGCVFCVTEKSRIGDVDFTFLTPGPWAPGFALFFDTDAGPFGCEVSPFIENQFPNRRCWCTSNFDLSLSYPIVSFPYAVGRFDYQVAEEGEIRWVIDGPVTGAQSPDFLVHWFGEAGETCAGPAATEAASWGSVKTLFR